MKIVSVTARYLLGLLFTVFGLNGFLYFIHQPPPSANLAKGRCKHRDVILHPQLEFCAVD